MIGTIWYLYKNSVQPHLWASWIVSTKPQAEVKLFLTSVRAENAAQAVGSALNSRYSRPRQSVTAVEIGELPGVYEVEVVWK